MRKKNINRLSLITFATVANLRAKFITVSFVVLLMLVPCASGSLIHAQYCNPATVSYIVRDENGQMLSAAELMSVCELLPKSIGEARVYAGESSFADDGKTFYWSESSEWEKGVKVPSLQFINNATCTMNLAEVTLIYHGKKMRLVFNVEIARAQPDRRPVIDSLPFQEGTFELDLSDWSHDTDKIISSERWKQVKYRSTAGYLKPRLSR
jgi:hypothetical protein